MNVCVFCSGCFSLWDFLNKKVHPKIILLTSLKSDLALMKHILEGNTPTFDELMATGLYSLEART